MTRVHSLCTLLLIIISLFFTGNSFCQSHDTEASASPKSPWGEFTVVEEQEGHPWWADILLWAPNRVMDLVDVFKADIGFGPAYGGVLRMSKYAQVGYRHISPSSVRIGAFGRHAPVIVERSDEYGIGPGYVNSRDRSVCKGEIGVGADLFLVGGYGGVCVDELVDFVAGIFFVDVSGDDVK